MTEPNDERAEEQATQPNGVIATGPTLLACPTRGCVGQLNFGVNESKARCPDCGIEWALKLIAMRSGRRMHG